MVLGAAAAHTKSQSKLDGAADKLFLEVSKDVAVSFSSSSGSVDRPER